MGPDLPDKLFFRIGEVAKLLKLKTSVLRFWETEFEQLKPRKSASGQRLYSKSDVERLIEIQHLLYKEKMTIEGARKKLNSRHVNRNRQEKSPDEMKEDIVNELLAIRQLLS